MGVLHLALVFGSGIVTGAPLSDVSDTTSLKGLAPAVVPDNEQNLSQVADSTADKDIVASTSQHVQTASKPVFQSNASALPKPALLNEKEVPGTTSETIEMLKKVPVFLINLGRRPDRLKYTAEALYRNGIEQFERYEAVDGDTLDLTSPDLLTARARWELDLPRQNDIQIGSKGALGCFLSHLGVWDKIVEQNIPMAIIFEDDVDIGGAFWPQLASIWDNIKAQKNVTNPLTSLDGILLGWIKMVDQPKKTSVNDLYRLGGRFWGTQAYLITREGAMAMKQHALPINMQVDAHMSIQSYLRPHMHFYLPASPIAVQQWFSTSNVWVACVGCPGEGGWLIPWGWATVWAICTLCLAVLAWQSIKHRMLWLLKEQSQPQPVYIAADAKQ